MGHGLLYYFMHPTCSNEASLLYLPTETILRIIKQGLGPKDVVALSLTCRSLCEICYTLTVWQDIAHTIAWIHPLPLPPFKTLQTLTLRELVKIESNHRRLEICGLGNNGWGAVYHFAFLEGGRYLMILHHNGTFTCWDILQGSGVLLAQFVTASYPAGWNFQTNPEKAEVLMVLATVHLGESKLDVLNLTFFPDEEIQLKITRLASRAAPFRCEKISIHDNFVCVCSSRTTSPHYNVQLFVWDMTNDLHTFVDTGITSSPRSWDNFLCLPHGIMLYCENGEHAYTYWYEDARKLLEEGAFLCQTDPESAATGRLRSPDGSQVYTFDGDCVLSNDRRFYFVGHPINNINGKISRHNNLVSIISLSQGVGPRPGATKREVELFEGGLYPFNRTLTQHWFAPPLRRSATLPESSQQETMESELPVIRRWIHHIPFDALASDHVHGDMACIGSHGTHLLWIWDDIRADMEGRPNSRLFVASLLPTAQASERGFPSEAAIRDVNFERRGEFGIDLRRVTTMYMEDSHGIVGLGMYPKINGALDGTDLVRIHLLYL
ncbi:hypothetical protein FRB95_008079 [Tulasnella sp. JGI-2019a]|nr:hypothetical protein FRB95_008079 [Tulasnella sp. JGI-2019a]